MIAQARFDETGAAAWLQNPPDIGKEQADIGDVMDHRAADAGVEHRIAEAGLVCAIGGKAHRQNGRNAQPVQMPTADPQHVERYVGEHRIGGVAVSDHRAREATRATADLDDRAERCRPAMRRYLAEALVVCLRQAVVDRVRRVIARGIELCAEVTPNEVQDAILRDEAPSTGETATGVRRQDTLAGGTLEELLCVSGIALRIPGG